MNYGARIRGVMPAFLKDNKIDKAEASALEALSITKSGDLSKTAEKELVGLYNSAKFERGVKKELRTFLLSHGTDVGAVGGRSAELKDFMKLSDDKKLDRLFHLESDVETLPWEGITMSYDYYVLARDLRSTEISPARMSGASGQKARAAMAQAKKDQADAVEHFRDYNRDAGRERYPTRFDKPELRSLSKGGEVYGYVIDLATEEAGGMTRRVFDADFKPLGEISDPGL